MQKLNNKHIVITGGTSGIGLELVKSLASDNHIIVISKKGELPNELQSACSSVTLYHANLAKKDEIELVFDKIQRQYTSIDVLINNAAVQYTAEFLADDFCYDSIQTEVDINFTAICHLSYLFLPMLMLSENAHIINVNSGLAIAPKKESAVYCATKSALDSFSKSLSYQLEGTRIKVGQVFLPLVETPMTKGREAGKLSAEYVARRIINGLSRNTEFVDIGKVRWLRFINYIAPRLARYIMKAG